MGLKLFKPINIIDSRGYWPERGAIVDGITELLSLGLLTRALPVRDFGRYRDPNWRDSDNKLRPYQSVDWFVAENMNEERFQVNSRELLRAFEDEPWRREELLGDHYDLFVLEEDMFDPEEEPPAETYAVGSSRSLIGAVVSTHRIDSIWGDPYSYLKTEIMRQLCFTFGIPGSNRKEVQMMNGQCYCTNVCILRHACKAPGDWERLTFDRLRHGALCPYCLIDIRNFFAVAEREARREGDSDSMPQF